MRAHDVITAMLLVVGVIHLLPVTGVAGGARLEALYGVRFDDPTVLLLMRHRALLFGLLGAFMVYASFRSHLHGLAVTAGWVSVLGFLVLAWHTPMMHAALTRVVIADLVAAVALAVASVLLWMTPRA